MISAKGVANGKIMGRKNIYNHAVTLQLLTIKNSSRSEFRKHLESIHYMGYEVEQLSDGRKIVITKPGGKFVYGRVKREDFMVWIHNPTDSTLWLISHNDTYTDLEEKGKIDPQKTIKIIDALEAVYAGEEPDAVLLTTALENPCGVLPEVLLKAYKWIWGQEDCNYPDGKGRAMSWEGWAKDKNETLIKTGMGIADLRNRLRSE